MAKLTAKEKKNAVQKKKLAELAEMSRENIGKTYLPPYAYTSLCPDPKYRICPKNK